MKNIIPEKMKIDSMKHMTKLKKIEKLPDNLQNMWSNVSINEGYEENLEIIKNLVIFVLVN